MNDRETLTGGLNAIRIYGWAKREACNDYGNLCALGALAKAQGMPMTEEYPSASPMLDRVFRTNQNIYVETSAIKRLAEAIQEQYPDYQNIRTRLTYGPLTAVEIVYSFNDDPETKQEDVEAVFEKTIFNCED